MNEIDWYKRIPIANMDCRCDLCGNPLSKRNKSEKIKISVYKMRPNQYMMLTEKLLYCHKCGIFYASHDIFMRIKKRNFGFSAYGTRINKSDSIAEACKKINSIPPPYTNSVKCIREELSDRINAYPHQGYKECKRINSDIPKVIFHRNIWFSDCPFCKETLKKSFTSVPVSERISVIYPCYTCAEHLFTAPSDIRPTIITDNPYARDIKSDFTCCFVNKQSPREVFESNRQHIIALFMKNLNSDAEMVLIVSLGESIAGDSVYIINHKEEQARKILAQIIVLKEMEVEFQNQKYFFVCSLSKNRKGIQSSFDPIIKSVEIKKYGGFTESVTCDQYEIVSILLFSPYKGQYEESCATYDRNNDVCFMDIRRYRSFVREFGNPQITLYAPRIQCNNRKSYEDWETESLLFAYGYNASKVKGLSDDNRCVILAEFADLNIWTIPKIVSFLESLIKSSKNRKGCEEACKKWTHDCNFIINYKIRPERFLIAGNSK